MDIIKGYIVYYGQKVPVTWEDETEKYAKNVRKLRMHKGRLIVESRIFDDKVSKKEIIFFSPH